MSVLDVSSNPGNPGGLLQGLVRTNVINQLAIHEISDFSLSDIQILSQLIKPGASLKRLKIGNKVMSSECIAVLLETLLSPSSLEILELWWIMYTPENANKFELLENNTNLASIRLMNNFDGINMALQCIAKALGKNKSLRLLGILSENIFSNCDYDYDDDNDDDDDDDGNDDGDDDDDDDDVEIQHYDIGADSIKILSDMLMVNSTLTRLEIDSSKLTKDDLLKLTNSLQYNYALEDLWLTVKFSAIIDRRIRSWHPSTYHRQYFDDIPVPKT